MLTQVDRFCILLTFAIYLAAGTRLFRKTQALRTMGNTHTSIGMTNPFAALRTTEIQISYEEMQTIQSPRSTVAMSLADIKGDAPIPVLNPFRLDLDGRSAYDRYTVTIERGELQNLSRAQKRRIDAAISANNATWAYTKTAFLYFISLNITWIPSSINRVWSVVYDGQVSWGYSFAAGFVLPLMGFWNAVIYIITSWDMITALIWEDIVPFIRQRGRTGRPVNVSRGSRRSARGMERLEESNDRLPRRIDDRVVGKD